MYQSRYHLDNEKLSLAIDSQTGQLVELVWEETGENLLKNHLFSLPQPFALYAGALVLRPGDSIAVTLHPELIPQIVVKKNAVTVTFHFLWDGEKVHPVQARYQVRLKGDTSLWLLELSLGDTAPVPETIRFPCINGVWFGENWESDTLVYPHYAGLKIVNPVKTLAQQSSQIDWAWQNYRYTYLTGTMAQPAAEGGYALEGSYTGTISMKWLDYSGQDSGLYFACHDPALQVCSLRAHTFGPGSPGMSFSFSHPVCLRSGESWQSPEFAVAIHPGDWHESADRYRAFHQSFMFPADARPAWMKTSAGLVAHYDFKYQNGGIVHRYEDIFGLLEDARALGLNHLLLAGWHQDGFDNGFPQYIPDSDLGSSEELKAQLAAVKEAGGHVSLYVNTRIANPSYSQLADFLEANAVKGRDGRLMKELCAGREFAVMCIGSQGWRDMLAETAARITGELGADGLYLDQLSMGEPGLCFNADHQHLYGQWNYWYQQLLEEISAYQNNCLLHEGCSDAYGSLSAGQLVSTFVYHHTGAFPQLYRYTFPEQALVDMLYPCRNLAMRPVHVAQVSRALMDRAFVTGMYFWIYDLQDDNTFTRDPQSLAYLKSLITLRNFWLKTFGQGIFRDNLGLKCPEPSCSAARYDSPGRLEIACANPTGKPVFLKLHLPRAEKVTAYTLDAIPEGKDLETHKDGDGLHFLIPETPLSLIIVIPGEP